MIIDLGNTTLVGSAYYVRAPDTNAVAMAYSGRYEVIERLVTDPPYVTAEE